MSKKRGHEEASGPEDPNGHPSNSERPRKKAKRRTPRKPTSVHQNIRTVISYHHPFIAEFAPILTSATAVDDTPDAIKRKLVRVSDGNPSVTVEMKCSKCEQYDQYGLSTPPAEKGPWNCTIHAESANSMRRPGALMNFLRTFTIDCDRCQLIPSLPRSSLADPMSREPETSEATSNQLEEVVAVASPVKSSEAGPATPSSTQQKPKDWGVKTIRGSTGKGTSTMGKTGFAGYLPCMKTVGEQAVSFGLYATKVLRCPQLAQLCYGLASDQRLVDTTAIAAMAEEDHAQVHALSTNMKTASDHGVRPRTNVSRDVKKNMDYVVSHDFAWIEKSCIIPEAPGENGQIANMALVDVESTPYNDRKTKLRLAFVEPIPGTQYFRVWWMFTFKGQAIEVAVPLEADRRAYIRVLEMTSDSHQPLQTKAVYVADGHAKDSFLNVVSDTLPYSVAMAPAEGTLTTESKVFVKACEMQLHRQKHKQYAQSIMACGYSRELLDSDVLPTDLPSGEATATTPSAVGVTQPLETPLSEGSGYSDRQAPHASGFSDASGRPSWLSPPCGDPPCGEMTASAQKSAHDPAALAEQSLSKGKVDSNDGVTLGSLPPSHTALADDGEEEATSNESEEGIASLEGLPKTTLTKDVARLWSGFSGQ